MKCANCGTELKVGCVYCSVCGKEAQIVSENTILEDEYLSRLLDEQKEAEKKKQQKEKEEQELEEKEERNKKFQKKKRKKILMLILLLVCLAAVLGGCFWYRHMNSFDSLYKKAEIKYNTGMYQDAETIMKKALEKENNALEGHLLLGKIYAEMEETDQAEAEFQKVLDIDSASLEGYQELLKLYAASDSYEKITALKEGVSDEAILALFEDYLIEVPSVDIAGGTYNDFMELNLSVQNKELEIYYTLDGSDPVSSGEKYADEAIPIRQEGETILKAVSKNQNGDFSEVLEETYQIELAIPDMPVVSPDGGQFTEISGAVNHAGRQQYFIGNCSK